MQISPTSGNFPTFVDDMLLPFRAYAMDHGITLSFYKHLPNAYIMFDREAMTKIITNLLGNAIKFTPDGGKVSVDIAHLQRLVFFAILGRSKKYRVGGICVVCVAKLAHAGVVHVVHSPLLGCADKCGIVVVPGIGLGRRRETAAR